jgi:hypothetical protein
MFYAVGVSPEAKAKRAGGRGSRLAVISFCALALSLLPGCGIVGCVGTSVYGVGLTVC